MAEPGPKPVEASQSEGRAFDQSGHPVPDSLSTGLINRAEDDATGYPSNPNNFDAGHSADPDPPVEVNIP